MEFSRSVTQAAVLCAVGARNGMVCRQYVRSELKVNAFGKIYKKMSTVRKG